MKPSSAVIQIGLACFAALFGCGCESTSPLGFEEEVGAWRDFDLTLSPGVERPDATVITDCDFRVVVYSVATRDVAGCEAFGPIQDTLDAAIENALDYFDNDFRCESPNCIRKVGRIVWAGWSCDESMEREAVAAVLVEMWCEVEL